MTSAVDLDAVRTHLEARARTRDDVLGAAVRDQLAGDTPPRYDAVVEELARQGFHVDEDEVVRRTEAELPVGTVRRSDLLSQIEVFVTTAVASGVIGNLAYDVLRSGLAAVARRSGPDPAPEEVMALLARAAVVEQCDRHDLARPDPAGLRVGRWQYGPDGASAPVISRDGTLHADVHIGGRGPDHGAGATVLLRQVVGPGERTWLADRARALVESPALAAVRASLERVEDEPLDRRAVERALRRVTSDAVSLHELVGAVERARRSLADAASHP